MRNSQWVRAICGATILAGAVAGPALAKHGKAGLWDITIHMQMGGMPEMPDMSKMSPEMQARMRAMNVQSMGGHSMTVQHCMTAEEVMNDKPPVGNRNKSCTMTNQKVRGNAFSGDMTCDGDFKGTGHVKVVYDSAEHYTGQMDMQGTSQGHPMNMHQTFEGKWVGESCKGVKH